MIEGPGPRLTETTERIKRILRRDLKLPENAVIDDAMPLVGGEFDLDSLDILLLVTSVEKEFGIKIASEKIGREAFASVSSLSRFVDGLAG